MYETYPCALYKGDEFIMLGTIKDLAEVLGVKEATVSWYASQASKKRRANRKNAYIVVRLDKEEAD